MNFKSLPWVVENGVSVIKFNRRCFHHEVTKNTKRNKKKTSCPSLLRGFTFLKAVDLKNEKSSLVALLPPVSGAGAGCAGLRSNLPCGCDARFFAFTA